MLDVGDMPDLRSVLVSRWALVVFATAVCLWGIAGGPRLGDHECINAQAARQTLTGGKWLIPSLGEEEWIRKPPLGIWLIAASAWLVDSISGQPAVTELSARLPQAVAGLLNVLVMAWMATRMFGVWVGRIAGLVAAASVTTMFFSHSALIEMTLTLFVTTTFACVWRAMEGETIDRRWLAVGYTAFTLAMMAKMPLPLAIVVPTIGVYWLFVLPGLWLAERAAPSAGNIRVEYRSGVWTQLRRMTQLWSTPGMLIVLLVCGGWTLYVSRHVDGAWQLWRQEYLDRFTGDMAERSHPIWYYLPVLLGLAAPFSLFVPEAVATPILQRYRRNRRPCAYLLAWGLCGLIVLSLSAFKRPHYLAAIMPPFLILLALVVDRVFFASGHLQRRAATMSCTIIPAVIVVAATTIGMVLAKRYAGIERTVYAGVAALTVLWALAAVSYGRGWRALSLAGLVLGSPVMLALGWKLAAYDEQQDLKIPALATALATYRSGPNEHIIQIDSRVDARLLFHERLPIEPLFTPVQLAQLRPTRSSMTRTLVEAAYQRVKTLVNDGEPHLFIMDADRFDDLQNVFDLPLVELDRVGISRDDPSKANVILGERRSAAFVSPVSTPVTLAERTESQRSQRTIDRPVACGNLTNGE
jgi:4-amino-4-deoxy-L-arabinose transferase-like glycosyltransferase